MTTFIQKIRSSYKIDLLIRAGIPGGAAVAYRMLRCALFKRYKCVFYRMPQPDADTSHSPKEADADDVVEFGCYDNPKQIDAELASELKNGEAYLGYFRDIEQLLQKGNLLFVGRINNKIASAAWVIDYCYIETYFFPVSSDAAVIYRCAVAPNRRGRNLYAKTLRYVTQQMGEKGKKVLFIDCWDYNYPSIKGIQKAGFRLLGYSGYGLKGHVFWKQVTQKLFYK